jgi:UDPglucose 6-dehydrogenase
MQVTVYGLWHLGCVTAACLAEAGHQVVGLDLDAAVVDALAHGQPPLHEPGLAELVREGMENGRLTFTSDAALALRGADVVWVAFDTPVNDADVADVDFVRRRLEAIAGCLSPGTLVLISSQVPAGFTRTLENSWASRRLRFAYSPENLRLGRALDAFRRQERIVVGLRGHAGRNLLAQLLQPFTPSIVWMSIESAEMTKHALNAFLATSVSFMNEIARLCEAIGADAKEVERGLKSEGRIGPRAYLAPGAAFAGGTLARDVRFLIDQGRQLGVETPLAAGVLRSNDVHKAWLRRCVHDLLPAAPGSVVAVLGLAYKPGTSTLRRSTAIELCRWLHERGVVVQAHDPCVYELPADLQGVIRLVPDPQQALDGADLAVVASECPEFRSLGADDLRRRMRTPRVIDPNHFLARLRDEPDITYVAPGKAA